MKRWRLPFSQAPTICSVRPGGEAAAERIDVGGVEEVDAAFRGGVEDGVAARFVALAAEGHGAEAEAGHAQSAAAESDVFHAGNSGRVGTRRERDPCTGGVPGQMRPTPDARTRAASRAALSPRFVP